MTAHKITTYLGMGILALGVLGGSSSLAEGPQDSYITSTTKVDPGIPNLTSLNVRLSHQVIQVPQDLVKHRMDLPGVRAARSMIAPSPKAAILEDDNHNRAVILSALEDGKIHAQLLADLDLQAKIPFVTVCAHDRKCAYDRRPITGGLGCIAICVQQALDPTYQR